MPKAKLQKWTPEQYHTDVKHVGSSGLRDFHKNPALFYGRYRARTIPPGKATPDKQFGTLSHSCVLQPNFSESIIQISKSALSANGARAGKAWLDFQAEHAGKQLLKPEDYATVRGMLDSLQHHDAANKLLIHAEKHEVAFTWVDQDTGVKCKALVDAAPKMFHCILDLKTAKSAHPEEFAADAYRMGYHRQAAWYAAGWADLTGEMPDFVFVVVEKEPPYRVECIQLDADFLILGDEANAKDLADLAVCQQTGVWKPKHYGEVITVSAPRYAFTQGSE